MYARLTVAIIGSVPAESHTIKFTNKCGRGTILSSGEPFTSNGAFSATIAYLQTGGCCLNGGFSTDLSLIPPLAFDIPIHFEYANGCDGQTCTGDANCNTAFHVPSDTHTQVQCQVNNVNLNIFFCP
ncbi:hypothetical protein K435DRAFT_819622 [Dendrothele bispora CBS 962.96]|uniref:Glycopeptide n=1 Tax=Dendrothele bispora (strain CBS 962.96) TaxID=1314807 RepID=A0A4V4HFP0_DENBC|nr:hypothetical protein K435DRAFT_819622 [Dendrothele bispora CBS 962.96]